MRDLYGRLIDGLNGNLGQVRSGGDALAGLGQQSPPPTSDLVVFFEGPLTLDADGTAQITLDLPAFDGTLRLMAVAWSEHGVGQASQDVILRDPVVVTATVPRFMAPDDQSRMLLEITHADGPAGDVTLSVQSDGLALASGWPGQFTLAEGETRIVAVPFAAGDAGTHQIDVALTAPDGSVLKQSLIVPVVVNDPAIGRTTRLSLAPGETFRFDDNAFAGFAPGSARATLAVGPLARFDGAGLMQALDAYPYGCTEQITSRALPLLYFSNVAEALDLGAADVSRQRVAEAIQAIRANQSANGSFGLWRAGSGDLWLDAYVTDFLSRAQAVGHDVPSQMYRSAINNLRNRVNTYPDFDDGGADLAYALMVLARDGAAAIGDLRYYADQKAGAFDTPLAAAQLGAALAQYGDQVRADALFLRASRLMEPRRDETRLWRADYGTQRRDAAGVLALAVEAGSTAIDRDGLVRDVTAGAGSASTQEAAWTLLAANALLDDPAVTDVRVNGAVPDGPVIALREGAGTPVTTIENVADAAVTVTVSTFGVPDPAEPAGGNGYQIRRAHYDLDGQSLDLSTIATGTRFVTVLTVTPFGRQEARLMVNDPLPAGIEIDNPNLLRSGDIGGLDWLEPVAAQATEFRSDRFLAAVDRRSDEPFYLAYMARAISPGTFRHPAASVEDMYRPEMRARTATGQVIITP